MSDDYTKLIEEARAESRLLSTGLRPSATIPRSKSTTPRSPLVSRLADAVEALVKHESYWRGLAKAHTDAGDALKDERDALQKAYTLRDQKLYLAEKELDVLRAEVQAHLNDPDFDAHHKALHAERDALRAQLDSMTTGWGVVFHEGDECEPFDYGTDEYRARSIAAVVDGRALRSRQVGPWAPVEGEQA